MHLEGHPRHSQIMRVCLSLTARKETHDLCVCLAFVIMARKEIVCLSCNFHGKKGNCIVGVGTTVKDTFLKESEEQRVIYLRVMLVGAAASRLDGSRQCF